MIYHEEYEVGEPAEDESPDDHPQLGGRLLLPGQHAVAAAGAGVVAPVPGAAPALPAGPAQQAAQQRLDAAGGLPAAAPLPGTRPAVLLQTC